MTQIPIIPLYTSRGDAEAFLRYPYLYNRLGEWIGWVTPERQVYSVLGVYVGELTNDRRIIRRRSADDLEIPRKTPPPPPPRLTVPANVPLAPLMGDLPYGVIDVLGEEPERLHTLDVGEEKEDWDR